jgi:mannose-1-phosphate guanylyltransferase/phosphomannomutase
MINFPTQAVILSAGLGTRLRPLTDNLPKVMVPLLGKPILEWHICQFKRYGIKEFFVNLHYLPEAIKNYFGDGSKWGVRIHYFFEPKILGTAGGLKQFKKNLSENFFVIYGDLVSLVDYRKMGEVWSNLPGDALGIQRVQRTDVYEDADVVEMNSEKLFLKIHPKPHSYRYENAYRMKGVFILNKEILSYVPEGIYFEIGKNLLPKIVSAGKKFYGYECEDFSKGVDTLEILRDVEKKLAELPADRLPINQ